MARKFRAKTIVQIAYYRPSTWGQLEIDGKPHDVPQEVFKHFRNLGNIEELRAGPQIKVLMAPFDDRGRYMTEVLKAIAAKGPDPKIVFLDPDTGLEPRNPSMDHVLESEVKEIWDRLQPWDVLVFYQHKTNRNGQPWIEPKMKQLSGAIGVDKGEIKLAVGHNPNLAQKSRSSIVKRHPPENHEARDRILIMALNQVPITDEAKVKKLLKAAMLEVLVERRDLVREALAEAVEDIGMVQAIKAGSRSRPVSRDAVFKILRKRR